MAELKNQNQNKNQNPTVSVVSHEEELLKIKREEKEKATAMRAKAGNFPYIDLRTFPINPDVLHMILPSDAKQGSLMPFFKVGKKLRIAVSDLENTSAKTTLKKLEAAGYEFQLNLATEESIGEAQKLYASAQYKPQEEIKVEVQGEQKFYEEELKNLAALKTQVESLPAEEALAAIHAGAIKTNASDIHYQPEEKMCSVRFRIDGVLHKVFDISKEAYANIENQLKYKAKMKLNVTTIPQDGRYAFTVNERRIDVRVASLPTEYGEAISCRILDTGKRFNSFEELGFMGRSLELLKRATDLPYGMVLSTGPTGSGKTTTLYALLKVFNKPGTKIITLEDPIEYHLQGLVQSQVDEKKNYTFATGLRSILRHDPDVVMIGEIRDLDTATTACQAALTGHVLLSTLHTNSAVEAIPRLLAIGVPPFVIAPALNTIIAQRLVRRICETCEKEKKVAEKERKVFEETLALLKTLRMNGHLQVPESLKVGKGCDACSFTGFRGQLAISEVFMVDGAIQQAILTGSSTTAKLFELARSQGMLTMREDGILKALQGLTTLEEVFRVTIL